MLIATGTKPRFTAGPLDVLCVLHDTMTDRYHLAFFEEAPTPGPVPPFDEMELVRLKSKMHHTQGAESMAEALLHMDEMLANDIELPESNICRDAAMPWGGDLGITLMVRNWRKRGGSGRFGVA